MQAAPLETEGGGGGTEGGKEQKKNKRQNGRCEFPGVRGEPSYSSEQNHINNCLGLNECSLDRTGPI